MYESIILVTICVIVVSIIVIRQIVEKIYTVRFSYYEKELLEYLEQAYNIVYIEDIVVYASSMHVIGKDDKEYTQLLNKLLNVFKIRVGSKRYKFYIKLLGGKQQLIDYINLYFSNKLYDDLVRHAIDTIPRQVKEHD